MQTNKDLLGFLFGQMEALEAGVISIETAKEQANLAKQANNAMKFELDRASLLLKIEQVQSKIQIREFEGEEPEK